MLLDVFALVFLIDQPPALDIDKAFKNLKAAEGAQDVDAVKKWAVEALKSARLLLRAPEPISAEGSGGA